MPQLDFFLRLWITIKVMIISKQFITNSLKAQSFKPGKKRKYIKQEKEETSRKIGR